MGSGAPREETYVNERRARVWGLRGGYICIYAYICISRTCMCIHTSSKWDLVRLVNCSEKKCEVSRER